MTTMDDKDVWEIIFYVFTILGVFVLLVFWVGSYFTQEAKINESNQTSEIIGKNYTTEIQIINETIKIPVNKTIKKLPKMNITKEPVLNWSIDGCSRQETTIRSIVIGFRAQNQKNEILNVSAFVNGINVLEHPYNRPMMFGPKQRKAVNIFNQFLSEDKGKIVFNLTLKEGEQVIDEKMISCSLSDGGGRAVPVPQSVIAPVLTSIDIAPRVTILTSGETQNFIAVPEDQRGHSMNVNITWSTSNTTVGKVDSNGLFVALKAGNTTVLATNGSISGMVNVTIIEKTLMPVLTKIEILPAEESLYEGDIVNFVATGYDQNNNSMTGIIYNWTSSNLTVGNISVHGVFFALEAGQAIISAVNDSVQGKIFVTVNPAMPAPNVTLKPEISPTPMLTSTSVPVSTPTPLPTSSPVLTPIATKTPIITPTPLLKCMLNIEKEVDKISANIGDTLTYTLNFSNSGNADCTGGGVKIKDIVSDNIYFANETHSANVASGYGGDLIYNSTSRTLLWNASTLSPQESGWVSWKAVINNPEGCGSFNIYNIGSITSWEYSGFDTWVKSNEVKTTFSKTCPIRSLID